MPINIQVPGSKSISNRYLILAALKKQKFHIENIADSDDTKYLIKALKQLGYKTKQDLSKSSITITPPSPKENSKEIKIFTGNAGTTTRFLTAFCALNKTKVTIDGDERMRERPIGDLINALNGIGAEIQAEENNFPPLHFNGKIATGGKVNVPGNISSQYLSALLMISPFTKDPTIIQVKNKLCSKPYVDITIKCLEEFGITIKNQNYKTFSVRNKNKSINQNLKVESDASGASYIGAYAALHPKKEITIKNINKKSIQGDIQFLDYLQKMGCKIHTKQQDTIIKSPKKLKCLNEIDMNSTPDLVMTFAALAMITPGITKITNIANLRVKETDRISALKNEISKFDIKVKTKADSIEIHGQEDLIKNLKDKSISISTYNDHRIAMAFGIFTELLPNLKIKNPQCVNKSYPNFWKDLKKLKHAK